MWRFKYEIPLFFNRVVVVMFSMLMFMASCKTSRLTPVLTMEKKISGLLDAAPLLGAGFSGLVLYDPASKQTVYSRNAHKYFTPASNIKLLTLYACLKTLKDSIPALRYIENDSSMTIWGTGDPTFLHPFFSKSSTLSFLQKKVALKQEINLSYGHSSIEPYGKGWMWDDYNDYYQAELTSFPMFGNILYVRKDSLGTLMVPRSISENTVKSTETGKIIRDKSSNFFTVPTKLDSVSYFEQEVPYKDAEIVNHDLLESMLGKKIQVVNTPIPVGNQTVHSIPVDTVYKRMMLVSDNMLAEHLLLLCGTVLGDTISTKYTLDILKSSYFKDIPQALIWVDGSGLSRYNMVSPNTMVAILEKLYTELPHDRLFSLLPSGGGAGTLDKMFMDELQPYVYAKSGSMSGVYNLSGFVISPKGKIWIFSFMNNLFTAKVSAVKKEVETIIHEIRNMMD